MICDLCENPCNDSFRYAHKPYMFRFYHDEEYERQVEQFQQRKIEFDEVLDEGSIIEARGNGEESDYSVEYASNASQLSDWTDDEICKAEKMDGTEDDENNRNERKQSDPEIDYIKEEREEDKKSIGDDHLKSDVESEYEESDLYEDEVEKFEDEQWETDQVFENSDEEVENPLSTELISSIANHSKSSINKHLDITMAASAAIITALSHVNDHTQDVTKTYTNVAIATVGIAVGMKGLLTAARPHQPTLPQCKNCKNIPDPNTGCRPFCHSCGECSQSSIWKEGSRENHCLVICQRCDKNCVLCETNVATVKRHHNDFCTNVHGHVSTKLSGKCRDGSLLGSWLLMAGVMTCAAVPGIGWGIGAALIAAGILVCAAVRMSSSLPNILVECLSCNKEEDAENYVASEGCQSWCTCCGVFKDEVKDEGVDEGRNCLQLCDDCSPKHD